MPDITPENWQTPIKATGGEPSPLAMFANDEPLETPVDRVFAILDANRDAERAIVKLFRVVGANKYEWCDDYPVPDFESGGFKMIRETWGPGEYEVRLYGLNERGLFTVLAKPRVNVAPSPNAAKPAAPAAPPEMLAMMRQMQEQNAAIVAALSQRPDPMAQMQSTFAILSQARELFGGGNASGQKSSIREVVEAMRELRAVNEEINPQAGAVDPDNPMALLPGVLDLVKTAIGNRDTQAAQPAPPVKLAPLALAPVTLPPSIAVAEDAAANVTANETPDAHAMNVLTIMSLRAQLGELCRLADRAAPVADGAALLYEKLPDEFVSLLAAPNWWEMLGQVAPDAATPARRAWLTQARDLALREFNSPGDGVADNRQGS